MLQHVYISYQSKELLIVYWHMNHHCDGDSAVTLHYLNSRKSKSDTCKQETPQCDETRFSTIQPSIYVTGIRNERWQWWKIMMSLFWLHWLHAPSLVSIGQSKLKLLSGNWISIFNNSDLDFDHIHLGSNPKLRLDVSYPYTTHTASLVSIGQSKLKLLSGNQKLTPARTPARPHAHPFAADFSITIIQFLL